MKREHLEHLIRAAGDIADDDAIVVIGSQAILGQFPDAPPELCVSNEADVFPLNHPERWELIDGSIGELSPFHDTFGYYAQGVEESTAHLPAGWRDRLVEICGPGTRGVRGLCLEIHDLLVSKYIANRDKDRAFCSAAARHGLASNHQLHELLALTPIDEIRRQLARQAIDRDYSGSA